MNSGRYAQFGYPACSTPADVNSIGFSAFNLYYPDLSVFDGDQVFTLLQVKRIGEKEHPLVCRPGRLPEASYNFNGYVSLVTRVSCRQVATGLNHCTACVASSLLFLLLLPAVAWRRTLMRPLSGTSFGHKHKPGTPETSTSS